MLVGPECDDRRTPISNLIADELITTSGARPSDHIIIAGSEQLELLITLIRQGFSNVSCQSAKCGPHSPEGEADILLVPSARSEADLLLILRHLGCALRRHGVVVIHTTFPSSRGSARHLRQTLVQSGFTAIERLPSHGGVGDLWCAYKYGAALAHAA
jgi:hypothetical protein